MEQAKDLLAIHGRAGLAVHSSLLVTSIYIILIILIIHIIHIINIILIIVVNNVNIKTQTTFNRRFCADSTLTLGILCY